MVLVTPVLIETNYYNGSKTMKMHLLQRIKMPSSKALFKSPILIAPFILSGKDATISLEIGFIVL
jgi:hypothetical protein